MVSVLPSPLTMFAVAEFLVKHALADRQANIQFRMPTARDATSAMVASDMADSAIIRSLALTVRGSVSAGENAVALVNARNR
jgi:hypothetical protein